MTAPRAPAMSAPLPAPSAPLPPLDETAEWLEADGLGGFASGTAQLIRTRRYHALLLAAAAPPSRRFVLVNGVEVWANTPRGRWALSAHRYSGGYVHPDGASRLESFDADPWPRWTWRLPDGARIRHEVVALRGSPTVVLTWALADPGPHVSISVRPLMSGREIHSLHRQNSSFRADPESRGRILIWRPYHGVPATRAAANGRYEHAPDWYRNFEYSLERERGLDCLEDLLSPGIFHYNLSSGEAHLVLSAETPGEGLAPDHPASLDPDLARQRERERRRAFPTRLDRSADAYIVARHVGDQHSQPSDANTATAPRAGKSIIAGYPWFGDWGRDTFICLRGLCLATGRLDDARDILLTWAATLSQGMLPNQFPESGSAPEYNSVDAPLWFIIAAQEYLAAAEAAPNADASAAERRATQTVLRDACLAIVGACYRGTRHGIRADRDALLACGEAGVQLTWMDAKVGDRVITPRTGKPVEIQALWINALKHAAALSNEWQPVSTRALNSFRTRFWNPARSALYDVVDAGHVSGAVDAATRPNQVFAVGGLPLCLLDEAQARAVVDRVEGVLLTPAGLRTLAPDDPAYVPRYEGGPAQRDAAYHQGAVWPWLMGPFVEAWVRVRRGSLDARRQARARFLEPLLRQTERLALGHLYEIADAEHPHRPRGCPCQAWSLAELLRLDRVVLGNGAPAR